MRLLWWASLALWSLSASVTHAQQARVAGPPPESEHIVTLAIRGGAMASDDQRHVLEFDAEGASAELTAGLRPLPWLATEVSIGGLAVGGRGGVGALLDATLGLRAMPRFDRFTPYLHVAVGLGVTGTFLVPVLAGSAGFWIDLAGEWSAGPEVSLIHVLWEDGALRTSDAVFVSAGLALTFRPRPSVPPAPETIVERVVTERIVIRTRREPPPPRPPPEELLRLIDRAVPATVQRHVASMVPPLLFEHDRTELSSCGEASLYDLLRAIDDAPADTHIVVEGHADGTGEGDYNAALSLRRAEVVRDFLLAHGIAAERIEVRARGEGAPLVAETDGRALSLNRRVVVHLERLVASAPPQDTP